MAHGVKSAGIEFRPDANEDVLLQADYHDISAYHGGRYPAGTALGQKALELARSLLFPEGGCFARGECSVETPFAGKGFEDALEMVLRCTSLGRYTLDLDMPVPQGTVPAPVRGKFFYRFSQGDGYAELAVKPGLVPEEFYKISEDLHWKRVPPEAEEQAMKLRRKIEAALMETDPADIFHVHGYRPCTSISQKAHREAAPSLTDDFRLRLDDYGEYLVGIEQLRRYHGNTSLCGLCLAWSLVRQWTRMDGIGIGGIGIDGIRNPGLPRRSVKVKSGALGDGIRDAFEFLFRGKDGRVVVDTVWGDGTSAPKVMPGSGAFVFQLSSGHGPSRTLVLKEKAVPREYLRLSRIYSENPAEFKENEARKALQLEFARCALKEPELFDVL